MKFFKKIGNFFKRVGAYLKANKRTLGGIITSILTGGAGTTVCVFGYTYDLTDLIASLPCFEWVRQLAINGFDLTPIICGVIIWLIAIWNAVAAVSRGWESPEEYKAANDAEKADKENDTSDETDSTTTVSSEKTENQKVVVSSTVNVDSKVDTAVNALDALIASQNIDNK